MSALAYVAPGLSRRDIRSLTSIVRKICGCESEPFFPIVQVIESDLLSFLAPGFHYEIRDLVDMGNNHGLTLIEDGALRFREDIYNRACCGKGRDRMTLAHELGHAMLHVPARLARRMDDDMKPYEDPEWQAKCFAGELLISYDHLLSLNRMGDVSKVFGVSEDAARIHCGSLKRSGVRLPF